mgnify:CR=1 FL=1
MKKVVSNVLAVVTVSVVKKIKFNIKNPSILGGFFIAFVFKTFNNEKQTYFNNRLFSKQRIKKLFIRKKC